MVSPVGDSVVSRAVTGPVPWVSNAISRSWPSGSSTASSLSAVNATAAGTPGPIDGLAVDEGVAEEEGEGRSSGLDDGWTDTEGDGVDDGVAVASATGDVDGEPVGLDPPPEPVSANDAAMTPAPRATRRTTTASRRVDPVIAPILVGTARRPAQPGRRVRRARSPRAAGRDSRAPRPPRRWEG